MVYQAGMIGCGRIGSDFADDAARIGVYTHAGAYAACPDTELAAICDADGGRLQRCGQRWGVASRYTDFHEMLCRGDLDIVSVCTPDPTHEEIVGAALRAPGVKAVLAEKPLALCIEGTQALVATAQERGVLLAVNYSRRFAPSHRELKRFLDTGGIGDIRAVHGYYTKGVFHNGTHWFDLVRWLVGEVAEVEAFNPRNENGPDPTLDVRLVFANGAVGYFNGCDAADYSIFEMDLIGRSGRVRITASGHEFEVYAAGESQYYSGYRALRRRSGPGGGLRDVLLHAVTNVVAALNGTGPLACGGADAVAALRIAAAACESVRLGRSVCVVSGVR